MLHARGEPRFDPWCAHHLPARSGPLGAAPRGVKSPSEASRSPARLRGQEERGRVGTMDSRLLMTLQVAVAGIQKIGAVPHGTRGVALISGGHFEGPRLQGRVLQGSGDWTLLRGDGVLELDLRLT